MVRHGAIAIGGVTFSIIYDADATPGLVTVYTDFGKLPSKREIETYIDLMQSNLILHPRGLPICGISPVTRNVTLSAPLHLEHLTPEKLRDLMGEWAARAKTWQDYLCRDSKEKPNARRRGTNWDIRGLKDAG